MTRVATDPITSLPEAVAVRAHQDHVELALGGQCRDASFLLARSWGPSWPSRPGSSKKPRNGAKTPPCSPAALKSCSRTVHVRGPHGMDGNTVDDAKLMGAEDSSALARGEHALGLRWPSFYSYVSMRASSATPGRAETGGAVRTPALLRSRSGSAALWPSCSPGGRATPVAPRGGSAPVRHPRRSCGSGGPSALQPEVGQR